MYNTNGVINYRERLEISQQAWISETERFRTKIALDVWNTYVCENHGLK